VTITDGDHLLYGQYTAAGFHLANDGAGGTAIVYYSSAHSAHGELVGNRAEA